MDDLDFWGTVGCLRHNLLYISSVSYAVPATIQTHKILWASPFWVPTFCCGLFFPEANIFVPKVFPFCTFFHVHLDSFGKFTMEFAVIFKSIYYNISLVLYFLTDKLKNCAAKNTEDELRAVNRPITKAGFKQGAVTLRRGACRHAQHKVPHSLHYNVVWGME